MSEKIQPVKTTLSIIEDLLKPEGYVFKKAWNSFVKKEGTGNFHLVRLRSLNHRIEYVFEFAFMIRHDLVEKITQKVAERFSLEPVDPLGATIACYYPKHRQPNECPPMKLYADKYLEIRNTDFFETVSFVMSHINGAGKEFFERFSDLRQIDSLINGADFWLDDWLKPYQLGNSFRYKRLVIAYLCQNPRFDEFLNFDYVSLYYQNNPHEDPTKYEGPIRIKGQTANEYLIELLKDVKTIF